MSRKAPSVFGDLIPAPSDAEVLKMREEGSNVADVTYGDLSSDGMGS